MKNLKIVLLVFAALIITAGGFVMRSNHNDASDEIDTEIFTDEHMKWIKTDTFIVKLKSIYGNDVTLIDSNSRLKVNIRHQNKGINDFVNTRSDVGEVKNFDFNIDITNKEINATFKTEIRKETQYIHLPNDVIAGLVSQLN